MGWIRALVWLLVLALAGAGGLFAEACERFPRDGGAAANVGVTVIGIEPGEGRTVKVHYQITTSSGAETVRVGARIQLDLVGLVVGEDERVTQSYCREATEPTGVTGTQPYEEEFTLVPPGGVAEDPLAPPFEGTYRAAVEVAFVGGSGAGLDDQRPDDDRGESTEIISSDLVIADKSSTGSVGSAATVHIELRNTGDTATGPLRLTWVSDTETADTEAPSLPGGGGPESTQAFDHSFARGGRSTMVRVASQTTGQLLASASFELAGGGTTPGGTTPGGTTPGGTTPGGATPGGTTPGGTTPGGTTPGGTTPGGTTPGTGAPDYEIGTITVATDDPATGVYRLLATITNRGGDASSVATVQWNVQARKENGAVQSGGEARSEKNQVGALRGSRNGGIQSTDGISAVMSLGGSQDPEQRATRAVGTVTVDLAGDADPSNNVDVQVDVPLSSGPDTDPMPPVFVVEDVLAPVTGAPGRTWEDSVLNVNVALRNNGGMASRVAWNFTVGNLARDDDDASFVHDRVAPQEPIVGSAPYRVPVALHPTQDGPARYFTGTVSLSAEWENAAGDRQAPVLQDLPFRFRFADPYPEVDLGVLLAASKDDFPAGGSSDSVSASVGEEVFFTVTVKNFGAIAVSQGHWDKVELEFAGAAIALEGEMGVEVPHRGELLFKGKQTMTCADRGDKVATARLIWADEEAEDEAPEGGDAPPGPDAPAPGGGSPPADPGAGSPPATPGTAAEAPGLAPEGATYYPRDVRNSNHEVPITVTISASPSECTSSSTSAGGPPPGGSPPSDPVPEDFEP